jgi:predicted alpha/beta-fold hydrolase
LQKPRWNLFGDSGDLEQIYNAIRERFPNAPFFYVGISSGSKLPIEAVGKFDERRKQGDMSAPSFVATSCLCPGYNLETCFMGFKFPYKYICLSSVKSKFLHENEAVLRAYDVDSYEKAQASDDLQSLLSHAAPFAGYSCAEEYFAVENPVLFASQITTPTLIINSLDDPCTVPQNAFGTMPGSRDGLTFADMVEKSPCGILLMSPSGSHCPFLDGQFWPFVRVPLALGGLVIASWADSCILEFFEGYLAEEKKSR